MHTVDTPQDFVGSDSAASAESPRPRNLHRRAWWIAGGYAIAATVWIFFSDTLLAAIVADADEVVRYSTAKGVVFVVVTAVLLFTLARRAFGQIDETFAILEDNEHELERLGRLHTALIQINQAIVRQPDRRLLLEETCRALVDECGFAMAWVGWHDHDARRVVPVAHYGDHADYLDDVAIFTDERPEGQGPSGSAFRDGTPHICNDMVTDPAMAPWRQAIIRHGFRATGSFPIRLRGQVWGMLNVYALQPSYFRTQEVALLVGAAGDLSYALDNQVRDAERADAEALAREERLFSDTMIDSMPGVLYFYDTTGRFLRWNRNFELVSGYSADEVGSMNPLDFFDPVERDSVEAAIARTFADGEATVEAAFLHRDGTSTPYFFTGRRVELEERVCLVGVGIDITERKHAESALQELLATLELRVAERTEELEAALLGAEAADRIKSAFLATMSHELRTPLNSIIGFTGIVLQGLAGPLTDEQTKQLGMVQTSARHLLALINDVLDLSKIEAGQFEVSAEPYDLGAVLERVSTTVRPLADAKGLSLVTNLSNDVGTMVGDERRVEQILLNLLSNAIKFTDTGSVTLEAEQVAAGDAVQIRVIDTGIGIAESDLQLLFQPFRQIDSGMARQHEGTGLGLAICRRLASLMGGTVSASSVPGVGSEFCVTLPTGGRSEP